MNLKLQLLARLQWRYNHFPIPQLCDLIVSKRLIESGYELVVFSRNPDSARERVSGAAEYVAWKPEEQEPWEAALDGAYGVVNLAGAPFFLNEAGHYKLTALKI
jgi:hypothetical protein